MTKAIVAQVKGCLTCANRWFGNKDKTINLVFAEWFCRKDKSAKRKDLVVIGSDAALKAAKGCIDYLK